MAKVVVSGAVDSAVAISADGIAHVVPVSILLSVLHAVGHDELIVEGRVRILSQHAEFVCEFVEGVLAGVRFALHKDAQSQHIISEIMSNGEFVLPASVVRARHVLPGRLSGQSVMCTIVDGPMESLVMDFEVADFVKLVRLNGLHEFEVSARQAQFLRGRAAA